jgi:hypothetical protein
MGGKVAASAVQAWEELKHAGGLELTGRDSDLAEDLRNALDTRAETL